MRLALSGSNTIQLSSISKCTQMADWTIDWNLFGDWIQLRLAEGSLPESLAMELGGKKVIWNGVLLEKDLAANAPMIVLEMPQYSLRLDDGRCALLPNLVVPLREDRRDEWANVSIGRHVTFSAVFHANHHFLSPIQMTTLRSGRVTISLRLADGTFVSHD